MRDKILKEIGDYIKGTYGTKSMLEVRKGTQVQAFNFEQRYRY